MPQLPTPYDTDAVLWFKICTNSLAPAQVDGGLPWQRYVRQMIVALGGNSVGPDGQIVKEFCRVYAASEGAPDTGIGPFDTESSALHKLLVSLGVATSPFSTYNGRLRSLCQYTA